MSWWHVVLSVFFAPCLIWFVVWLVKEIIDSICSIDVWDVFVFLTPYLAIIGMVLYPWYKGAKWLLDKTDLMWRIEQQFTAKRVRKMQRILAGF